MRAPSFRTRALSLTHPRHTTPGNLVKYLEDLSAKFETLNEGSAVVAKVVANWDRVFAVMATADQHESLVQTELTPEDGEEEGA